MAASISNQYQYGIIVAKLMAKMACNNMARVGNISEIAMK
jgi:hypothetical protein